MLTGHRLDGDLAKYASGPKMVAIIRRGLYGPATAQCAKQLRAGLREMWRSVEGEATAAATEWRAINGSRCLEHEAARHRWGEILNRLRERVKGTYALTAGS